MPALPGSRLSNVPTQEVAGPDGAPRRVLALQLRRPAAAGRLVEHVVAEGETVDLLAARFLGDSRLWPAILDANPVIHPFDIRAGMTLRIPAAGQATQAARGRRF